MKPCANGATCLDGVNRFSCLCPVGFTGRFCTVNVDDCASRPCLNAARCLDRAGGFHCICQPGFTGATCETTPGAVTRNLTVVGKTRKTPGNSSLHGDRLFKVTVSERSAARLSETQLVVLLVLAGLTLGAVVLTATLVLQGHCRNCGRAPCWSSSSSSWQRQKRVQQMQRDKCQVSFLNTGEPEKKKLNTEIM